MLGKGFLSWNRPKYGACFFVVVFSIIGIGAFFSRAQGEIAPTGEFIKRFDVTALVDVNSVVTLRETIQYDFGTNERHGIFRDIPTTYTTKLGAQKKIALKVFSVTDENDVAYHYTESTENGIRHIKIGDPEKTVHGLHTYVITYSVRSVLSYFSDFDEFYWNVTGNGWKVPIERGSYQVVLPSMIHPVNWRVSCYVGLVGSSESCGNQDSLIPKGGPESNQDTLLFSFSRSLRPGEGITVAVGFPKKIVEEPEWWENSFFFLLDNPLTLLPFFAVIIMGWAWYRFGRDPQGRGVIIPEYDVPDSLSTLEIAGLMKERVTGEELSAAIIDLAVQGYIRIERSITKHFFLESEEYTLQRLDKGAPQGSLEQELLDALFQMEGGAVAVKFLASPLAGLLAQSLKEKLKLSVAPKETLKRVELSQLKNTFYQYIPGLQRSALSRLVERRYFRENPQKVRLKYMGIGGVVVFLVSFVALKESGISAVAIGITATIYMIFAWLMPKVTPEGAVTKERLLGLKEYLQIAEKNRLEFHNAPEKNPELFEKLLPTAMILGVSKIWAKEFADIYTNPPSWYSDATGRAFTFAIFQSDLLSFSKSASSVLASAPSGSGSGGSGSSGGGFGGGGGGSW